MTEYEYEHRMIRQLADHLLNGEDDDYEHKLTVLAQEFEDEEFEGYVIGDRKQIEQKVDAYLASKVPV